MNILLISGHGAGDPGATASINGTLFKEADETRKVTKALQKALEGYCNVSIYPTNHNAFSDHKSGALSERARFSKYDYVLEVHFNASKTGPSDGKTKGVECYVTTSERTTKVEETICKHVSLTGLRNRGVKRYNWSVINAARRSGVSSALLEVCFIDDVDDMNVYTQKFEQIIDGIAKGIIEVFDLKIQTSTEKEEENMVIYKKLSDVPDWGKATVKKLLSKGYLKGTGDNLNLEENMLRGLIVNDRAGLYDIKQR